MNNRNQFPDQYSVNNQLLNLYLDSLKIRGADSLISGFARTCLCQWWLDDNIKSIAYTINKNLKINDEIVNFIST